MNGQAGVQKEGLGYLLASLLGRLALGSLLWRLGLGNLLGGSLGRLGWGGSFDGGSFGGGFLDDGFGHLDV